MTQFNLKQYQAGYQRSRRLSVRDYIWKLKSETACFDCQQKYEPWVMQFDHREPSDKSFDIARGHGYARERVLAELAKCDVVCANCHHDRTHRRRQERREVIKKNSPQLEMIA